MGAITDSSSPSTSLSPTQQRLADYSAPYPEPTSKQRRYVIYLVPKENESSNYKVQLVPGRVEDVDRSNHFFIGGSVEEKNVEGWGYSYYVVTMGPTAGTRMMPLGENAIPRPRFIAMQSDDLFIRYNSKLPIVVYVPKDAELRYRIWSAEEDGDGRNAQEE